MTDFTTVGTFEFVYQAQFAQSLLEAEGIECHAEGLELVNMDWGLSNAIGNIKILTATADAARARQILTSAEKQSEQDHCLACGNPMPESAVTCSQCGWSFAADGVDVETDLSGGELVDLQPFTKSMISAYLVYIGISLALALLAGVVNFILSLR